MGLHEALGALGAVFGCSASTCLGKAVIFSFQCILLPSCMARAAVPSDGPPCACLAAWSQRARGGAVSLLAFGDRYSARSVCAWSQPGRHVQVLELHGTAQHGERTCGNCLPLVACAIRRAFRTVGASAELRGAHS